MNRIFLAALQKSLNIRHLAGVTTLRTSNNIGAALTRPFSNSNSNKQQKKDGPNTSSSKVSFAAPATQQKKFKTSPKITLSAPNQALSVTSLEEAQKLAKRRDLHLVMVNQVDAKTQRPTYKLVTAADLLHDELTEIKHNTRSGHSDQDKNSQKKSEKSLTIGARITDHDLASRLKNISKWLVKRHEVRILIQGSPNDMSSCDKIIKTIEQSIKEPLLLGKIVQKHTKGAVVKFIIIPVAAAAPSRDATAASSSTA